MIDAEVRVHVQLAVAYLQLILIALRGHRPYTRPELVTIFEDVGRQFFSHLERIAEYNEKCRVERQRARHLRNPARHKLPIPFRPRPRFVLNKSLSMNIYTPHNTSTSCTSTCTYTHLRTAPHQDTHIYRRTSTHPTTRLRHARLRAHIHTYEHHITTTHTYTVARLHTPQHVYEMHVYV